MFPKWIKQISLQWRLTLLAAAVTAVACMALTAIIGKSANIKMDEITEVLIEENGLLDPEPVSPEEILIFPEYYDRLEESRQRFNMQSILSMLAVIAASSLCTYFIAGRALRQLKEFSETIEHIQAQNLSEPLESAHFPKEMKRLAISFNKMLASLEKSFHAQKQFASNAAHELRTPLAVMQAKLDVFGKKKEHECEEYEQILQMLGQQTERLSELVSELLEMTSLDTVERSDSISLQELTEEVLCDLEYQARQRNIRLLQQPGNAEFFGNEILVYRAIFNLVENAIKYNKPEGEVTVQICQKEQSVLVTVSDTGGGIPAEYQQSIFEPFFRIDKSRSREMGGAGIGLAMVKAIAEVHGGRVYVKESMPGHTEIALEFPL